MGLLDQIANEMNKKIAAKTNQKIHKMTNGTRTGTVANSGKHPLYIQELDSVLVNEDEHYMALREQCVEQFRHTFFVDKALNHLIDEHSFEEIEKMPIDLRESNYFKKKLSNLVDHHMRLACKMYADNYGSVSQIYKLIRELTYFPELDEITKPLLINDKYFSSTSEASRSILSLNKPIKEQFEEIIAAGKPECIAKFTTVEMLNIEMLKKKELRGKKLSDEQINYTITANAMMCHASVEELNQLKQWILYLVLIDDRSRENLNSEFLVSHLARPVFGIGTSDKDELLLNHGVDFVIANAIRCVKGGKIAEFNEEFKEWLSACGHLIAVDQYTVFQAVFNEIGAYSSECILLEHMFDAMIPHSVEQEKRLTFLKNNKSLLEQDMSKYNPVHSGEVDLKLNSNDKDEILIYDHRFLTWNTTEIEKYFKGLTISNKQQMVAAVVDKLTKNITIDRDSWNHLAINQLLHERFIQEFENDYEILAVNAGVVIEDEIDAVPSSYIKATPDSRYPYLSFLVFGEPVTKKQTSLSIVVLVMPESVGDSNERTMKQIVSVKEKHNPRIETYIETVKNIILEVINSWIIRVNDIQDIY